MGGDDYGYDYAGYILEYGEAPEYSIQHGFGIGINFTILSGKKCLAITEDFILTYAHKHVCTCQLLRKKVNAEI